MARGEMNAGGPAEQIPLTLPHRPAMTRDDFLVGDANREAIEMIDRWPHWAAPAVLLAGPVGSGKSHLVEIWREASGAAAVGASRLTYDAVPALVDAGAVALEDLHAGPLDEAAVFHLLNLAAERKAPLLLTSRVWVTALGVRLPDLASRLRALRAIELGEPDDDLLRRVIAKLFADRQIAVDPDVVDYIVPRMVRSLEGAQTIVAELDREALARAVPVSKRLAAAAMARIFDRQPDLFAD